MTALAAAVCWSGDARLAKQCGRMLAAQSDYGSERQLLHTEPQAALGITPRRGRELAPLATGRYLLCADVRVDNREELSSALGRNLALLEDQDILLAAWEEWGERALDRIAADFAFILFDRAERSLILARDPTGQVPLFFAQQQGTFFAASMPSGLRAVLADSRCDAQSVARHLSGLPLANRDSWYTGVERVRPGEMLRLSPHSSTGRFWWNPDLSPAAGSDEHFIERYRACLDEAVQFRLSDAAYPVATHLSSGYDSSAVTATASRLLPSPDHLIAFTSAPAHLEVGRLSRGRIGDESGIASQTAAHLGVRHVIVREQPPLFETVRRQTLLGQAPLAVPFNTSWWAEIRRQAKDLGADTLLTGENGNLTLSAGGLWALADWVRAGQWHQWAREALAASRRPSVRWRGILFNSFGPWFPRFAWHGLHRTFRGMPRPDAFTFLRGEWARLLKAERDHYLPTGDQARDRLTGLRASDPGLLRKAAIADCGIAERDPTSDRRLIEFSLRLPTDQLLRSGQARPLARSALSDRLPRAVLDAQVRGLQSADWIHRVSRQEARDTAESIAGVTLVQDVLDLPAIMRAIDHWPAGDGNQPRITAQYRMGLIGALAAGLFLKQFQR